MAAQDSTPDSPGWGAMIFAALRTPIGVFLIGLLLAEIILPIVSMRLIPDVRLILITGLAAAFVLFVLLVAVFAWLKPVLLGYSHGELARRLAGDLETLTAELTTNDVQVLFSMKDRPPQAFTSYADLVRDSWEKADMRKKKLLDLGLVREVGDKDVQLSKVGARIVDRMQWLADPIYRVQLKLARQSS